MDERELARTLRALEERLLRLERFAGLEAPADAVIEPPPPPTPPLVPPLVPLPVPPPVPPLATPGETSARPRGAASSSISTEHIIGGRIAAWVGAIIVMIGVGVFVKYAYDRGWFVMFGGWGRLVAATVVAFGLIVLGWLSMRRWGRAAAAGLLCAGVGSLFVIAAAGTRPEVIGVLSPIGSLGYALAAIAIASFAAARSGLLAVSVVAAIGAYAVPLLVGVLRLETSLVPAGYLTLALAAFLALSHWASSQRQVRGVAVGLHIAVAALLLMTGRLAPAAAQAFVLIWWGLVVLETIASVVRAELRDDRSNTGSNDAAIATIATAASIVAAFVFAGAWAGFGDLWSWMPLGQGVLCVAASAVLHGMRGEPDLAAPSAARSRVWSSTESMPIARMSTTLGTIGAGAIAASLALLLTDRGAGAAWAIMAVAGTAVAVRIGSRGLAVLASLCCAASTAVAAWVSLTERVSGIGTGPVPIPWLSGSAVGISPGWWLPLGALLAAIASLHLLGSLASSAPIRGFLAVLAAISMATVALVVGRAESILLVAALLPAWLSFAPGRIADPFVRRFGLVAALLLVAGVVVAAVSSIGSGGPSDPTSQTLALLIGVGAIAAHAARNPTGTGRSALVAAAIAVAAVAVFTLGASRATAPRTTGCVHEIEMIAALAGAAAIMLRAVLGRGTPAVGTALWAASLWLFAGIVLVGSYGLSPAAPMSNLSNATAAVVLAALGATLAAAPSLGACAVLLVVLVAGTLDLERLARAIEASGAQRATLQDSLQSIWWGAVAVAGVISGFRWRLTALRWLALALLAAAAVKVLLFDLRNATTLARVGALLGVGLLMVGVGVVYARAERRLRLDAEPR